LIVRRPLADLDLLAQGEFIARDDPDAARRLLVAAERTYAMLERTPRVGRRPPFRDPRTRELRMRAITGFPNQIVFYRPIRGGIEVVRVLHAARDLPRALREP
jgi:toxin ParE1/3/4